MEIKKALNMKKITISTLAVSALLLSSCASVTRGTHQSLSVNTSPANHARCSLQNNKGQWYISNTPGSVVVNKSFGDLTVSCKRAGYRPSVLKVKSKTHPAVLGNVIIGGAIGAAADVIDGAAYEYPNQIHVPMKAK